MFTFQKGHLGAMMSLNFVISLLKHFARWSSRLWEVNESYIPLTMNGNIIHMCL